MAENRVAKRPLLDADQVAAAESLRAGAARALVEVLRARQPDFAWQVASGEVGHHPVLNRHGGVEDHARMSSRGVGSPLSRRAVG